MSTQQAQVSKVNQSSKINGSSFQVVSAPSIDPRAAGASNPFASLVAERTVVAPVKQDLLSLGRPGGAETKNYEVPKELIELSRQRKARAASMRPGARPTPVAPRPSEELVQASKPSLSPEAMLSPQVALLASESLAPSPLLFPEHSVELRITSMRQGNWGVVRTYGVGVGLYLTLCYYANALITWMQ